VFAADGSAASRGVPSVRAAAVRAAVDDDDEDVADDIADEGDADVGDADVGDADDGDAAPSRRDAGGFAAPRGSMRTMTTPEERRGQAASSDDDGQRSTPVARRASRVLARRRFAFKVTQCVQRCAMSDSNSTQICKR
jgi:hypothetical protein